MPFDFEAVNTRIYHFRYMLYHTKVFGIKNIGSDKEGRAKISQRNKFCVGDTIEIMKPDGRNIETTVLSLTTLTHFLISFPLFSMPSTE